MFHADLALELLDLCARAHANTENVGDLTLRGSSLRNDDTKLFRERDATADTEGFTTRSERGDIVVAFRGSETSFFTPDGAFTDWALTDLRSNRMPYPPDPKTWPNQRWVHRGFWEAYDLVRLTMIRDVQHLVDLPYPPETSRRIYVTGFSLGGALALLAAIDLGDTFPGLPIELHSFGAPRVGDSTLNKLLAERTAFSSVVGYRGDPVIHLPPLGPNFPVTFKHLVTVRIGPVGIPLGNPVNIQIGQQYQTADTIFYINRRGGLQMHLPFGMVTLRFQDHSIDQYKAAISELSPPPTYGRPIGAPLEPVLHMLLSEH